MNDEIKVGEYIRTYDGRIGKVVNIKEENKKYKYRVKFKDRTRYVCLEDIKKCNSNIEELLQIGDIFKYRIDNVSNGYIKGIIEIENDEVLNATKNIEDEDYHILEIVTKEQFEKIMYRVEE